MEGMVGERSWGVVAQTGLASGVRFARLPGTAGGSGTTPPALPPGLAVPLHARLAGRLVPVEGESDGTMRVDRTSLVALDGLLPDSDRAALLAALVCEREGEDPDAACLGLTPPASLWSRSAADFPGGPVSWGALPATLARVGGGGGGAATIPAAAALGSRLAALFPGCDVAFLPTADMQKREDGGPSAAACEPVMGTAATAADAFAFHTDADPALVPASPWTAAYGRYTNRDAGRPWLLTAVACLNPAWEGRAWGGELRVVDESGSGVGVLAAPAPGRVFLMDADALHCVTPPSADAPAPRFALVWKLAVMARGEGAPSGATAGPPFPPPATSGFSLGSALRAAGVEPPPPADLGGAATVAAAVRACKGKG